MPPVLAREIAAGGDKVLVGSFEQRRVARPRRFVLLTQDAALAARMRAIDGGDAFTVTPIDTIERLLDEVGAHKPDIVFLDDALAADAEHFVEIIRENPYYRFLPLLSIHAPGLTREQEQAREVVLLEAGVVETVVRDLPDALLKARLRSRIRRLRIHDEMAAQTRALHHMLQQEAEASRHQQEMMVEQERINQQLQAANERLQALSAEKDELLGVAAHDLRNPLSIIGGYVDFLLSEQFDLSTDEVRGFVTEIQVQQELMMEMLNSVLDITRIESGKIALRTRFDNVMEPLRKLLNFHRLAARQKGISLEFAPQHNLPSANFDEAALQQILNNLLSNAIKFSDEGAKVTLRVYSTPSELIISVEDTGQGIRSEELGKLFKKFGTTSTKGTRAEKSTGLGLAIVKKLVEAHGGRVWVSSVWGAGAKFYFSLPLRDAGDGGAEPAQNAAAGDGQ
jgi:signal transduction histidine kinase